MITRSAMTTDIAALRAEAAEKSPNAVPCGVARSQPFPGEFRAQMVKRDGQDRYHIEGYATVYEQPYEMWDAFGPYKEVMSAGAGADSLKASPDVAFLTNHRGVTMARTTNGSLRLSEDSTGLPIEAWLNPQRQDVKDLVIAIEDKDVTEMSFAFMIDDGKWSPDYTEYRINRYDINRGDVSAVNYGANPYTSVAARAQEILADLDHLNPGAARAALERLQHRPDMADQLPPADQTGGEQVKQGRTTALITHLLLAEDL
jgi:HK97 family phage prohead protease